MGTIAILWALSVGGAAVAGSYKGHAGLGVLLGVLLGPVGLVIALCVPASDAVRVERIRKQRRLEAMASDSSIPPLGGRKQTTDDVLRYYSQTAGE
jgi:hypothetical protein